MTSDPQRGKGSAALAAERGDDAGREELPLAMAAADMAGQLRERSPSDFAIFGESAGRLAERFARPEAGQALLARAVTDGSAETTDWLITPEGHRRFRVGLWRQRGGDRIRLVVAFAASADGYAAEGLPEPTRLAIARLCRDMQGPLAAVTGFAGMIRSGAGGKTAEHSAEIVAAAWRLMRVAEDLAEVGAAGRLEPQLHLAEVDIGRLARRIVRLAAPPAREAGVTIDASGLPEPGQGPMVLGDERALWTVIESLLQAALALGCPRIRVALRALGSGLALEIANDGPGLAPERLADLQVEPGIAFSRGLARMNGAELAIGSDAGEGLTASLAFPASRCLGPP